MNKKARYGAFSLCVFVKDTYIYGILIIYINKIA